MRFVAALDQGTTSTRCIIFDKELNIVAEHQVPHKQITPKSGWLEHDPEELYERCCVCIREAVNVARRKDIGFRKVDAIGITNQRETTVAWDKTTSKPLCNAIVWSDARTYETVKAVEQSMTKEERAAVSQRNGLPFSTYFSAFKMRWMLDNVEAVKQAQRNHTLRFGTVESWLMWRFSGGTCHLTDVTNASRTFLLDLHSLEWNPTLCEKLGIPMETLPSIRSCSEQLCRITVKDHGLDQAFGDDGCDITAAIGDQQSALFGNMCFQSGEAKNTYGTGCFVLMNVGEKPCLSSHGLLATPAYKLGNKPCVYAIEGSIAGAGATFEWLVRNFKMAKDVRALHLLADKVQDTAGVVFVPAFGGLLAPYWIPTARGTLLGLTLRAESGHIVRAVYHAITMQVSDVMKAMEKDSNVTVKLLKVDGGLSRNRALLDMQADVLGVDIHAPRMRETTALGACLCAGLAIGVWSSLEEIQKIAHAQLPYDLVSPQLANPEQRKRWEDEWMRAIEKSKWSKL